MVPIPPQALQALAAIGPSLLQGAMQKRPPVQPGQLPSYRPSLLNFSPERPSEIPAPPQGVPRPTPPNVPQVDLSEPPPSIQAPPPIPPPSSDPAPSLAGAFGGQTDPSMLSQMKSVLPSVAAALGPKLLEQQQNRRDRLRSLMRGQSVQAYQPSILNYSPSPVEFRGLLGGF